MLRLIPAPLHRALYRLADRARRIWWSWCKPQIEGCSVLAFDLEGRLMLLRLSYGDGAWTLPSGGLKRHEAPEQAARRELLEETGCEASTFEPVAVAEETLLGAPHRIHVFSTRIDCRPVADRREVVEVRFFPTHSLPEPLAPAARRRIALILDPRAARAAL